jgi:hypothetical protein
MDANSVPVDGKSSKKDSLKKKSSARRAISFSNIFGFSSSRKEDTITQLHEEIKQLK